MRNGEGCCRARLPHWYLLYTGSARQHKPQHDLVSKHQTWKHLLKMFYRTKRYKIDSVSCLFLIECWKFASVSIYNCCLQLCVCLHLSVTVVVTVVVQVQVCVFLLAFIRYDLFAPWPEFHGARGSPPGAGVCRHRGSLHWCAPLSWWAYPRHLNGLHGTPNATD